MVYCNYKVMLIDFSVLESKTYTFFLDDEMCELSLEKHKDHFRYGLNLNKEADTPLNRQRKLIDKKDAIKAGLFLAGLILMIGLLIFGIKYFQNSPSPEKMEAQLEKSGKKTTVRLLKEEGSEVWSYIYVAENKSYNFKLTDQKIKEEFPYPLPLASGDEFQVTYNFNNPNIHRIDWSRPNAVVVKRLELILNPMIQDWHPEMSTQEITCQMDAAYELKGLEGLSVLFRQQEPSESNQSFGQNAYLRLTRSPEYQKLFAEKCW